MLAPPKQHKFLSYITGTYPRASLLDIVAPLEKPNLIADADGAHYLQAGSPS